MASWFSQQRRSRSRPGTAATTADRSDDFVQLELERLEERCVLDVTIGITAGELIIEDLIPSDDVVVLEIDGSGNIEVFDDGMSAGVFSPDDITTGQITVRLGGGNDQLTLPVFQDDAKGFTISVDGGDGTDTINLQSNAGTAGFLPSLTITGEQIHLGGALGSSYQTVGLTLGGNVTLNGTVSIDTGTGDFLASGTLSGLAGTENLDVTADGTATFSGAVSMLNDLTVNADGMTTFSSTVTLAGDLQTDSDGSSGTTEVTGDVTTGGQQVYADAVTLAGNVTFTGVDGDADGEGVEFGSTVAGGSNTLTIVGGGAFAGAVSGVTTFTADSIDTEAILSATAVTVTGVAELGGDVTTTGQQWWGQMTLTEGVVLDSSAGNGDVQFASVISGDFLLSVIAGAGDVDFNGQIGFVTPLAGLSVSAANVDFEGTVAVDDQGLLVTSTSTTDVRGSITTTGGGTVQFANGGQLLLAADVSVSADGAVSQTGAGAVQTGADITTTGDAVSFASAVTLTDTLQVSSGAGAGNITFTGAVSGAQQLTVVAGTGNVTFSSTVGAGTALSSLTVSSAGNVDFDGAVTVSGALLQSAGTGTTTVSGVLMAGSVTLTTADIDVLADVTATSGGITLTGDGSTTLLAADMTTSGGDITINDSVLVSGARTLDSGDGQTAGTAGGIRITGAVGSVDATGDTLTLDARGAATDGSVQLDGDVGNPADMIGGSAAERLNGLTVLGSTAIMAGVRLSGGNLAVTAGAITLTGSLYETQTSGDISLTGPVTVSAASAALSSVGLVSFSSTLQGLAGTEDVSVTAGTTATFSGAVSSLNDLTVNADGTTTFSDLVTLAGDLETDTDGASGTTVITADVNTGGQQVYADGVTLAGNITFTGVDGDADGEGVEFGSTVAGGGNTLTIAGGGAFAGAVSGVTTFSADAIDTESTLSATTVSVTGAAELGGDVTTTGEQQYGGAVTLTGNVTFTGVDGDADGAGVDFNSTVAGGGSGLTVSGGGLFAAAVSGVGAFAADTVTTASTLSATTVSVTGAAELGGDVTTTGEQQYGGAVTLSGNVIFTGVDGDADGEGVEFASTVAGGGNTLTIAGGGSFTGAVSGVTTFTADTIDTASTLSATTVSVTGAAEIGGDVTTTGEQSWGGAVTLAGNVTFTGVDGDADGEGVEFGSTVAGGGNTLTIAGGGAFAGAVSGVTTFSADTIDTASTLSASTVSVTSAAEIGGDVTTTGEQSWSGAVTLTGNATFTGVDGDADGAGVDFNSTVAGGGNGLTVSGGGLFAAAVSGVGAFAADTVTTASTLSATSVSVTGAAEVGGDVTTTGEQVWGGAVTLTGNVTFTGVDTDADGEGVEFASTVAGGGNTLTIAGGGSFAGAVSGVTTFIADTIDTGSTLSASTVSVTGTAEIGGDVTTTGEQSWGGAVTLAGNITFTGVDGDADGEGVEFGSTVAGGSNTLTIVGGGSFASAVTGVTTFIVDTIDTESTLSATTVSVTGAAEIGGDVTTTGQQAYGGAVTLTADAVLDSSAGNGDVQFSGDVSGNVLLTITAGAGDVDFESTVGGVTPLSGLSVSAANVDFEGTVAVDDQGLLVTSTATTDVRGSITTTGGGTVQFANGGLLLLADDVSISADGAVSQTGAGAVQTGADITTTGDAVSFASAVTLTDTLQVSSGAGAGNFTFSGAVSGAQQLTVVAGTGNVTFSSTVGAGTALSSLTVSSAGNVDFDGGVTVSGALLQSAGTGTTTISGLLTAGSVTLTTADIDVLADVTATSGGITLTGDGSTTLLAADMTTSGGDITINDSVLVSGARTLDSGDGQTAGTAGGIRITGAVGSVDATGDTLTLDARGAATDGSVQLDGDVGNPADMIGGSAAQRLNGLTVLGSTAMLAGVRLSGGNLAVTAGAITLTGSLYETQTSGDIQLTGPVTVSAASAGLTSVGLVSFSSTLQGSAGTEDVTVTGGTTATFSGAVSSLDDLTVNADGTTTFSDLVTLAGDLETDTDGASGTTVITADVNTGGQQVYADGVTLAGNITFTGVDGDADGEGVEFGSTVAGGSNTLTIAGGGAFGGAVSGVTTFSADTIDTESTLSATTVSVTGAAEIGGDVTTTGEQVWGGAVTLAGNATFTGVDTDADGAGVDFNATVAGGGNGLTVSGGGLFAAAVSGVGAFGADSVTTVSMLSATTVSVTGAAEIGGDVSTTGEQQYGGAVTLTGDVMFTGADTDADGEGVEFGGAVAGGGNTLSIVGGGAFASAVTGVTAFTADSIDTASTLSAATVSVTGAAEVGGDVTTTGEQSWGGAVTLDGNVTFTGVDGDADGEGVEFGSTVVGGSNTLTIVGGGAFAGAVSGVTTFIADTIDTESTLSAATVSVTGAAEIGGDVTTSGQQAYGGAVTLTADVDLDSSAGGGDVQFSGVISGDFLLSVIAGAGDVDFNGQIGFVTPLSGLSVSAANVDFEDTVAVDDQGLLVTSTSTTDVRGSITTTGGGTVQFANGGLLLLADDVSISADGAVSQTGAGAVQTGADITTTGDAVSFASAVTLTDTLQVSSGAGAGNITFSSAVSGAQQLTVVAGTGNVTFSSTVGAGTALSSLTVSSAGNVDFDGVVTVSGALLQSAGTGTTTVSGVLTAGSVTLTTADIDVLADVTATSGGITLRGDGSTTLLAADMTTSGGDITINDSVLVSGARTLDSGDGQTAGTAGGIRITGAVGSVDATGDTLTLDARGAATDGSVQLDGDVGNPADMIGGSAAERLNGLTVLGSTAIMAGVRLSGGNLAVTAGAITLTGSLYETQTSGDIQLAGPVTVSAASAALSSVGLVSFSSTLQGLAGTEDVTVTAGTTAAFSGAVSSLADLTVNADGTTTFSDLVTLAGDLATDTDGASGTTVITADVNTGGQQIYADGVTLAGNITFTGVDGDADGEGVEFGSTVAGGGNTLTIAGGGAFAGAVSGVTTFSADTIDTESTLSATTVSVTGAAELGGDVTTTGEQAWGGAVTLAGNVTFTGVDGDADGAGVDFNATVAGGSNGLTVSGGGLFAAAVSGVGAFGADTVTTASTLSATTVSVTGAAELGGDVTTTGEQQYGGAVTLSGNVIFTGVDGDADGEGVEFGSTLAGGGNTLTIAGGGAFGGAVSGVTTFSADTIDTGSTLSASTVSVTGAAEIGGDVTTTGEQVWGGAVTLAGNVTFTGVDGDADGEGVEFASTVTGGSNTLTIAGGGAFAGAVSGVTTFMADTIDTESTLSAATVSVTGAAEIGGDVTTTGEQSWGGAVTLAGNATFTGVDGDADGAGVDFNATVAGGGNGLTVSGGGLFAAAVSGVGAFAADTVTTASTLSATTVSVTGAAEIGGDVTTTGEQAWGGAVTLTGNVTFTGVDGDADGEGVEFGSTLAGGGNTLTIAGGGAFAGAVSGVTTFTADTVDTESTLSASTLTVTGTAEIGGDVTTTGEQQYGGAVTLAGNVTFTGVDGDADGEGVEFGSTVAGGGNGLTVAGGGSFAGAVSGVDAFLSDSLVTESTLSASTLTVTGASEIGGDVTTTGQQEFGGAVLLTADVTFSGVDTDADGAGVEFSAIVDGGGNALTVSGGGAFATAIVNVSEFMVGGPASIASDVTTTGQQVYTGTVTLGANVVLTGVDTDGDGEGVEFGGAVAGGGNSLTIVGGGAFGGAVSGVTTFSADTVDTESTLSASTVSVTGAAEIGGDVTTTGEQAWNGAVTLTDDATFTGVDGDADGAGVDFNATVAGGGNGLTVSGGGLFAAAVSGVGAFAADSVTTASTLSAGTVSVTGAAEIGGDVTTTGEQAWGGAVTLAGNVTFTGVDGDADGEGVAFGSTVAGGGNTLTIVGGGAFAGAVSGVTTFTADTIDTASTLSAGTVSVTGAAEVGGDVTTTGEQQYGGAVTLSGNVTFTGVDTDADGEGVEFASTVAGGGNTLTIVGGGAFGGAVSGVTTFTADSIDTASTLSAVTVSVTGAAEVGGDITTTGEQSWNGAVTLTGNATFTGVDGDADGAGVDFNATVAGGGNGLTVSGGGLFAAAVSGVTAFTADSVTTASTLSATTVSVTGAAEIGGDVTTTGEQVWGGAVTLTGNVTFTGVDGDADGEGVEFGSTVAGGGNTLTIAGGGAFGGAVSNVTTFTADTIDTESTLSASTLTVTGAAELGGDVTTTGEQSWNGAVTLTDDATFTGVDGDANGEGVEFGSTVAGGGNTLTVVGGGAFAGAVSGVTTFSADTVDTQSTLSASTLMVTGTSEIGGDVTTTGEQQYGGAVTLTGDVTFTGVDGDADGEGVEFASTVAGGGNTLTIVGGGAFAGAVSGVTTFSADTIDTESTLSAGTVSVTGAAEVGGDITTTGEQSWNGAVTLTGNATFTGVDGDADGEGVEFASTVAGGGNTLTIVGGGAFAGAVSGVTTFTADSIDTASTLSAGTVNVTGAAEVGGDVTTTGEQSWGGAVTLTGNVTFTGVDGDADGEGVEFASTVAGGGNTLTIVGGGAFAGAVSGVTTFTADSIDTASTLSASTVNVAGAAEIGGDVTTTGEQSWGGAVTLAGNVTLTGVDGDADGEGVEFGSTVAGGGNTLTIAGGGAFAGAVSGVTTFTADTIDTESTLSASTVNITGAAEIGGDVTTTGEQQYGGAVTLTGDVTFTGVDGDADGEGVEFASTVAGGGNTLTIVGGGAFGGAVSGVTTFTADTIETASTLSAVTVSVTGAAEIGGDVTTTGEQEYGGPVTLTADVVFTGVDTDADGAGLEFSGLVDGGGNALTVSGGGAFAMGIVNVTVFTVTGATSIGADVTTTGEQVYTGAVTLLADVVLTGVDFDGDGEGVEFGSTVTGGGNALTIVGGGSFAGAVSGVSSFVADTLDAESTLSADTMTVTGVAELGGDVTTTGEQQYGGAVTLTGNVTLTGVDGDADGEGVEFGSTVAGGGNGLTVAGGGSFAGAVSGVTTFIADSIDTASTFSAGTVNVTGAAEVGGDVTTTGEQQYGGAVTLTGNVTFTGVDGDADGEGVEFASTVAGGGNTLTIVGGGAFGGAVSGVTTFTADAIDTESTLSAATVSVTGAAEIGGDVTTTGEQQYGGAVTLTGNVTFTGVDTDADGEGVEFASTVVGGGNTLTIVGGGAFGGAVSGVTTFTADTIDTESTLSATTVSVTGAAEIGGAVTTTGEQTYGGAVTLTGNVTFTGVDGDADGEGVEFGSTVAGGGNTLTVVGGGAFGGAVSGVTTFTADSIDTEATLSAGTVSVTGAAEIGGDVTTTGQQEYGGPVTLTADVVLTGVDTDGDGAGVEFSGTVTGGGNDLTVSGGGAFSGAVSGIAAFMADTIVTGAMLSAVSVTVTGAAEIGGDVTTTGEQLYQGPVTLTTDVTFIGVDSNADGAGLNFLGLVDGGGNGLTVTGGVNFFEDVINVSVLDVTGTTIISADVTSLDQQFYAGPVLLLADVVLSGVDTDGDGEGVEFASSVLGSGHSLTIIGGGFFGGAVNTVTDLLADSIDTESTFTAGTVTVTGAAEIGGNVTTTGQQSYGGAVSLTASTIFTGVDTDGDGEGVEFGSTVTGNLNSLTIAGGGSFAAAVSGVGGFTADHIDTESTLSAIAITVSGTAELGGDVSTFGTQTWGGAVTLEADVALTKPGGRGWIEFQDDVSGDFMLTVDADFSGVTFGGTVGGVTPLSGLAVNGSTIEFHGDVAVDDQGLLVTSMAATEVSGSITTTSGGTVQFANGGLLTLDSGVVITSDGAVTQTGAGDVQTGADISTSGDLVSFASAVTLTDNVSLATAGGNVLFAATLNGTNPGGEGLSVNAGSTGNVTFAGAVGTATRLGAVSIVNAGDVSIADLFVAESLRQQSGSGTTTIDGAVTAFGASGIEINTQSIAVNAAVDVQSGAAGGPMRLLAGDDLLVNSTLVSGNGLVELTAGDDVHFTAGGSLTSLDGLVTVTADADGDVSGTGGALTMADGTRIDAGAGAVRLSADENLTLSSVSTANGTAAAISITSTSGAVVDGGDSHIDLVANTPGAVVTIDAQTGVGATGALGALETTVAGLRITNAVSGDIAIRETDGLILAGAVQGGSGDVRVSTAAGSLTVTSGGVGPAVVAHGGSVIELTAGGATADLVVNGGIAGGTGTVTLTADGNVQFGSDGDVTTTGGSVTVTADDDASGTGGIVMDDGALIDSGTGTISLAAAGDITLGGLRTASSADDAVTITSSAGGVLDGGDTLTDVVAAGGRLVVRTATGVGSADAIETQVDRVDIVNSSSGSIGITDADALVVERIEQNGNGDVTVSTLDGTVTVEAAGTGIAAQQGTVTLTAGGSSSDVLLEQAVTTFGGDITITAGRGVSSTVAGTLQTTAASGIDSGSVTVQAGGSGGVMLIGAIDTRGATGGAASAGGDVTITTADASVTLTSLNVSGGGSGGDSGSIFVTAGDANGQLDGDVVLTSALTAVGSAGGADGTISLTAGGDIVDANDGMTQITTGDLALSASTNIGTITDFVAGTGNAIDVTVSGKLTQATITEAGGTIFLNVTGDLQAATGAINPDADGAATLLLKTSGALDLGTDAGVFTLTAGDNLGLEAGTTLTLPDAGLDLGSGSMRLVGGTDIVDASGRDLGLLVASDLSFVSGAAGGTTTLQTSVESLVVDLSTAPADAGLVVNENDAITLTQITTSGGDVTVNAGLVGAGDLTVVSVVAGGAEVVLDTSTTGGRIVDGSDAEIDIVADRVALRAVDGIADGDRLEIDASTLAATTQRGDINVIDPASGLVIGTVAGTSGLSITNGSVGDDIAVDGLGAVTVNADVRNVGGGDITLAARGTTVDRDLTINAVISTGGGNGDVSLFAGDSISVSSTGGAQASGTGSLLVSASTHVDDAGVIQNGTAAGAILMQSGALFGSGDGDVVLQASGDIAVSHVSANTDGDATIGNVTIVADFDGVGGGLSDDAGAVTDSSLDESANVVASDLSITAATGVGGPTGLETDVESLALTNQVSGDVIIHEVIGAGDNGLIVRELANQLGHVHVETFDGELTTSGAVSTTTGGNVTLIAGDADGDGNGSLNIQAAVTSQTGQVTLTSSGDDVTFSAAGDVTTDGTIQVNAGAAGAGRITQADGSVLDAGSGRIDFNAAGDVTVGRLVTSSSSAEAVSISTRGAVVDGGDSGGVDIDVTRGRLVIVAANGIGAGNAIETHAASLDVQNTAGGDVSLREADGVEIVRFSQAGSGDLSLTAAGTVRVLSGQPGVSATTGQIQIEATGAASDVQLDGTIRSTSGQVSVHADDDVLISGTGRIVSTSGGVDIVADADRGRGGSSGSIEMIDGAVVDGGSGDVALSADGSITIGRVVTTGMVSLTSAGGGIGDAGDFGGVDVAAGSLVIRSMQGIGTGNPLETSVTRLAALNEGGGDLRIDNTGGGRLTIDTVDGLAGISLTGSSPGQIVVTNASPLDVDASVINMTGGGIALKASDASGPGDDLTINAQIAAPGSAGHILLEAGDDLIIHDSGADDDIIGATVTGMAGDSVIMTSDVLVRSATGSVTQPLPLITDIHAPPVTAVGLSIVTVEFGRPGESNFVVSVDRSDGTIQTARFTPPGFVGPTSVTFEHTFDSNPNQENPSAPIVNTVMITDDPNITFFEAGEEVRLDPIRVLSPIPGEGLLGGFVFDLSIEVPQLDAPRNTIFDAVDVTPRSNIDSADVIDVGTVIENEAAGDTQVVIVQKIAPDGTVELGQDGRPVVGLFTGEQAQEVLEDIPGLIGKLRDGHFRIYLKEGKDGRPRLVDEFVIADGQRVFGDESTRDRPPTGDDDGNGRDAQEPVGKGTDDAKSDGSSGDHSGPVPPTPSSSTRPATDADTSEMEPADGPAPVSEGNRKNDSSPATSDAPIEVPSGQESSPVSATEQDAADPDRQWAALLIGGLTSASLGLRRRVSRLWQRSETAWPHRSSNT